MRRIDTLSVILAGALLVATAAFSQPPDAGAEIVEEDLGEDIETLQAEAEEVFRSADQPESIPLFERIILVLERRQAEGALDSRERDWLQLARFRRAEARTNLLDREGATADLTAIVDLDPAWEVPSGYMVSRLFSELLDGVRTARTGVLDVLIEPPDAELYLDGESLGPLSGPRRVLAGERLLEVRRPGYTEVSRPLTVSPGESVPIELTLERTSAVVRLTTRPSGVEVIYRGEAVAVSQPPADGDEEGVSADLLVAGLEPGEQLLTLRKAGYRPVERRVEIPELADYSLPLVALEPTRGTVRLSGVPATARVLLDGEPRRGAGAGTPELRLDLPPGAHELRVEAGSAGLFERRFELEDRQQLSIEVRLRPGLVLLGVLGGDRVAAADLERRLVERLAELAEWAVAERSEVGFEVLREVGVDRVRMRALAERTPTAEPPDWAALQAALDKRLAGSAYLLAVLSDDLYASRADLWLWSAAPGPTRPARRRVSLADGGGLGELAEELDRPLPLSAPWVGARFVDSPVVELALVLSVEPGSPAAAGGLRAGDTIVAMDGTPAGSARQLTARFGGLAPGSEVVLRVGGAGEERTVELAPAASPVIVSLNRPAALDPALAARLASLELSAEPPAPAWVLRLNRGVLLMRSGEWRRAAEALRGLDAPAGNGVGKDTVDYLLGVALLEVDRATYRDTALGLIRRAAEGSGRLEHNDGPRLAPRARARLGTLGKDSP